MKIEVIITLGIIVLIVFIFSLLITNKRAETKARKLYFDKMVESGNIVLPDCVNAYNCYLYEYLNFNRQPDCSPCKGYLQNAFSDLSTKKQA